jgi:Ca-activated chloride channel homolog
LLSSANITWSVLKNKEETDMPQLMRCAYCGWLQDEPAGVKACARCGGELAFETVSPPASHNYLQAQMELDQVTAPAGVAVERHLIVTLRTPPQVPAEEAAPTATGRKPLGFVNVLDVSGSMGDEGKLDQAKEAVRQAARLLREGDTTALVTFASRVETLLPPTRVEASLRHRLEASLGDLRAGGQTALCGGLEAGLAAAQQQKQDVNLVLLLSDGQANVGEIDLEKIGARALEATEHGVTVSTLGVGSDYNEALMAEIATQGGGRFYHVKHARQIAPYVAGELGEASALLAREMVLQLHLPAGAEVSAFTAAYHVREATQVQLGDIPADTTLEVVLKVTLPPQAPQAQLRIDARLSYRSPADHRLEVALNPVSVRFVETSQFGLRDGVVADVVKQVLEQMRAAGVLTYARTSALRATVSHSGAVSAAAPDNVAEVRQYASLLGEAEAQAATQAYTSNLAAMAAAPMAAKAAVASAHSKQRSSKKFD